MERIRQLQEKILELFLKLIEHALTVMLCYVTMRLLIELGGIILSDSNQWSNILIIITKIWFIIVFGIYALHDIIQYYNQKMKGGNNSICPSL
jgi:hypothetical protein